MTTWISRNRENLRFETALEKHYHKVISSLTFGEAVRIETKISSKEDEEFVIKAIKKSAKYNHMDVSYKFDKEKTSVLIIVEMW